MDGIQPSIMVRLRGWIVSKWKLCAILMVAPAVAIVGFLILSYMLIAPSKHHVFRIQDGSAIQHTNASVGLVLGAGVSWGPQGKPYKELQSRLDVAAQAYHKGYITTIILSGDNRFKDYNEPDVMKRYLVQEKGLPASALQPDYAGRSTYESCERASKIFGQKKMIMFSAASHLPRAVYLCRHFGIETYGVISPIEANNSGRRELLARAKAVLNIYVRGEPTILGTPIHLHTSSN